MGGGDSTVGIDVRHRRNVHKIANAEGVCEQPWIGKLTVPLHAQQSAVSIACTLRRIVVSLIKASPMSLLPLQRHTQQTASQFATFFLFMGRRMGRRIAFVVAYAIWLALMGQVTAFSSPATYAASSATNRIRLSKNAPPHSALCGPSRTRGRTRIDSKSQGSGPSQPSVQPTWALLKVQVQSWLVALQRRFFLWAVGWLPLTGAVC